MADPKFGRFEDVVELTTKPLRPITNQLNELLLSGDANACVMERLGDHAATYGVGPKKMSEGHCCILPRTDLVNLGFYKGGDFADPNGLLQGGRRKNAACQNEGPRGLFQPTSARPDCGDP